jgi:hypothetical protein
MCATGRLVLNKAKQLPQMTAAKGFAFSAESTDSVSHKYFNVPPFLFSMNKNVREKMQLSF